MGVYTLALYSVYVMHVLSMCHSLQLFCVYQHGIVQEYSPRIPHYTLLSTTLLQREIVILDLSDR